MPGPFSDISSSFHLHANTYSCWVCVITLRVNPEGSNPISYQDWLTTLTQGHFHYPETAWKADVEVSRQENTAGVKPMPGWGAQQRPRTRCQDLCRRNSRAHNENGSGGWGDMRHKEGGGDGRRVKGWDGLGHPGTYLLASDLRLMLLHGGRWSQSSRNPIWKYISSHSKYTGRSLQFSLWLDGKKRKNFNPCEVPPASSSPPCPHTHLKMLSLAPDRAVLTTQRPFPLCFSAVSTKLVGGKDQSWNLCWHYLEPSSTFAFSARLHRLWGQQDGATKNCADLLPPPCLAVWKQLATCHNTLSWLPWSVSNLKVL